MALYQEKAGTPKASSLGDIYHEIEKIWHLTKYRKNRLSKDANARFLCLISKFDRS